MLNLKMVYFRNFFVLLIISLFVGCSSSPVKRPQPKAVTPKVNSESKTETKPGGYYLDDGPGDNPPADIDSIPSATLKTEQPNARANKPYAALGQQYTPMTTYVPYKKQGIASSFPQITLRTINLTWLRLLHEWGFMIIEAPP